MFCGWRLAYLLSSESAKEHNLTKFYSLRQNIIFFVGQTIFLKQWGVTESSQSYWSVLLRKSGAAVATTYFELYIVLKIIEFEEHSRLQLWLNTDLFRLIAVESMVLAEILQRFSTIVPFQGEWTHEEHFVGQRVHSELAEYTSTRLHQVFKQQSSLNFWRNNVKYRPDSRRLKLWMLILQVKHKTSAVNTFWFAGKSSCDRGLERIT